MYIWISLPAPSASRNNSCAMMMFATSSSISDPRNRIRSSSNREKMSYVRSPLFERSTTYGIDNLDMVSSQVDAKGGGQRFHECAGGCSRLQRDVPHGNETHRIAAERHDRRRQRRGG